MEIVRDWFRRHFSNPQVVSLALFLIAGFAVVLMFGNMLAPVLASVVIAYLLEGIVAPLERRGVRRALAVALVFVVFMAVLLFTLLGILPRLSYQLTQLIQQLPEMVSRGHAALLHLPERYPGFISEEQVGQLISAISSEVGRFGQRALSMSVASLVGLITTLVYLILMPLLVFFFLKDKQRILDWVTRYLPRERALSTAVWHDVDLQIGNYVRGKVWEIVIVGVVTYVTFKLMGLQYAVLLGTLVGLSVIIPYIGATVATIPVALIAYFQWGWGPDFAWIMVAYLIIQALDGNVLVPVLFSEVVNLHPIAIIVAVLVFGGLWGFWGVFFAIPLATLVQAVLKAWPRALDAEAA
jgi:putative permease